MKIHHRTKKSEGSEDVSCHHAQLRSRNEPALRNQTPHPSSNRRWKQRVRGEAVRCEPHFTRPPPSLPDEEWLSGPDDHVWFLKDLIHTWIQTWIHSGYRTALKSADNRAFGAVVFEVTEPVSSFLKNTVHYRRAHGRGSEWTSESSLLLWWAPGFKFEKWAHVACIIGFFHRPFLLSVCNP